MLPKIHARLRRRHGIPYAIERLTGRQFRCRRCHEVFLTERQFDTHVRQLLFEGEKCVRGSHAGVPAGSSPVDLRVLYAYDVTDRVKRRWLKLKPGDEYDATQ